jgi:hypothetical protein
MTPPSNQKYTSKYKSYIVNALQVYQKKSELKAYLEIILSLLTVIIFMIFFIRPTLTTIGELYKNINTKKETLSKIDLKINQLSKAKEIYLENETKIDILKQAIPTEAKPENFVRQTEGIVFDSQVPIEGMKEKSIPIYENVSISIVNPTTNQEGIQTVEKFEFSLNANSSYQNFFSQDFSENESAIQSQAVSPFAELVRLLTNFENMRRISEINSLTINLNESNEDIYLSLLIKGNVLYKR